MQNSSDIMLNATDDAMALSISDGSSAIAALQRIAADQQRQNAELTRLMLAMDAQVRSWEAALDRYVTISGAQATELARKVCARARELCDRNSLPYAEAGRPIRDAIWRALRKEHLVSSHHDIQAARYASAIDCIATWSSYPLMTRLKAKHRGR